MKKLKIPAGVESMAFGNSKWKPDAKGVIQVDDSIADHLIKNAACELVEDVSAPAVISVVVVEPASAPVVTEAAPEVPPTTGDDLAQ